MQGQEQLIRHIRQRHDQELRERRPFLNVITRLSLADTLEAVDIAQPGLKCFLVVKYHDGQSGGKAHCTIRGLFARDYPDVPFSPPS